VAHSQEWLCHKNHEKRISKVAQAFLPVLNSNQPVMARAEEFEEAEVPQDLELLADFVANVLPLYLLKRLESVKR